MKNIIKSVFVLGIAAIALTACSSRLDVTNPNYFTDDDMQKYMNESEENVNKTLAGLVSGLPSYVMVRDGAINGGYTNRGMFESTHDVRRVIQSGDIVLGSQAFQTSSQAYTQFYLNQDEELPYWEEDQRVYNYGYYDGPVVKIGYAQKALDWLPDTVTGPAKKGYRAIALTLKAMGYMQLMERYTDLQDVASTTAQGWPIYDKYAYNDPVEPLSVADTWAWIKNAIGEAVNDFHVSNIGTNGYTVGTTNTDIHDVDCGVAQYIRARVALDMKDWSTAIDACNDLLTYYPNFIAPGDYGMDESKLASVASRNASGWNGATFNAAENAFYNTDRNPEVIFGEKSVTDGSNKWNYWTDFNSLKNEPSLYFQIDENLYNSLSDNDCRKANFLSQAYNNYPVYAYENGDSTWYHYTMPAYTNLKWAASEATGYSNHDNSSNTADFIYMRSSTVLLMGAEAYAQSGQDSQAKELLNRLLAARTKVGAPTMTCDNTMAGMSTLDMVKLQWRIEMWGENDWAFFNEKRWNEQPSRGANHWSRNQISHFTWDIPREERQGNPYWN